MPRITAAKLTAELYQVLFSKNSLIWNSIATKPVIDSWLGNFTGQVYRKEKEKLMALYTLSKFVFFREQEVRYLCRMMLREYFHYMLSSLQAEPTQLVQLRKDLLAVTTFSPLGGEATSSSLIEYYFRTSNNLGTTQFKSPDRIPRGNIACFLDDVTLTGSQAEQYHPRGTESEFFLAMIATQEAIDRLHSVGLKVIAPIILHSEEVRVRQRSPLMIDFDEEVGKLFTKDELVHFLEEYGKRIYDGPGLGFGSQGLLIGFPYNTPDNTMPIIWSARNWTPIFPRSTKRKESRIDEDEVYI